MGPRWEATDRRGGLGFRKSEITEGTVSCGASHWSGAETRRCFPREGGVQGGPVTAEAASRVLGPVAGKQTPFAVRHSARAGCAGAHIGTPGYTGGRLSAGPARWPGCTGRAPPGRASRRPSRPYAERGVGRTLCTHVCSDCKPLCRGGTVSSGGSRRWCTVRIPPST